MTFGEMTDAALALIEKTRSDVEATELVRRGINNAYATVARDKYRLLACEVMHPHKGKIRTADFSQSFVSLYAAFDGFGNKILARQVKDYIVVPEYIGKVSVRYYYLPAKLVFDNDEPIIATAHVDPYAYVYFAVSLYYSVKRQNAEAAVWDTRFRNIVDNIREVRKSFVTPQRKWC